jgi:hypothetical protein
MGDGVYERQRAGPATRRPMDTRDEAIGCLHQRLDKFYAWASQMQIEMRNPHQRVGFLETITEEQFNFIAPSSSHQASGHAEGAGAEPTEESLMARLALL